MTKYEYPAIFTKEEKGYSVNFPDLEGTYTCGDDLEDALEMAEDVLSLSLVSLEDSRKDIPAPSQIADPDVRSGEFVMLVGCKIEH